MKTKTINEMTDAELAAMVRTGCYSANTRFGNGKNDARFLLVLAVPYGKDEDVTTLPEAFYGFACLLQDDDWRERNIQVYDHKTGQFFETAMENIE